MNRSYTDLDTGKFVDRSGGDEPTDVVDECSNLKKRCRNSRRRGSKGSYKRCFLDAARGTLFEGEFAHPDKVDPDDKVAVRKQNDAFQFLNKCIGPDTEYGIKTLDVHEPYEMGWRTEEEAREAEEARRKAREEFDRVMTERVPLNPTELDHLWETYTTSGPQIGQGQSVHFSGSRSGADDERPRTKKRGGRVKSGRTRKGGGRRTKRRGGRHRTKRRGGRHRTKRR